MIDSVELTQLCDLKSKSILATVYYLLLNIYIKWEFESTQRYKLDQLSFLYAKNVSEKDIFYIVTNSRMFYRTCNLQIVR